jgi:hypothetical protein
MKKLPAVLLAALLIASPAKSQIVIGGGGSSSASVSVTAGTADVVITPSPGTGTFTIGTTAASVTDSTSSRLILSTDAAKIIQRTYTGGAMGDTLPNVSTSGFGSGFQTSICAASTQKDVVTPNSPSTINGASTFTIPANSCVSIGDPDGLNYVTLGIPPLSVGNGIVASGTADQLLYDNAGIVGEISKANSSVLVTNGAGTPTFGTTLPNGLLLGTPTSVNLTGGTALPLTTGVTGVLPIANGGTNSSSPSIAAVTSISGAAGTPDSTTYLRGDGTWSVPAGSSSGGGGTLQYSVSGLVLTSGTYYAPIGGAYPPNATEANVSAKAPAASTVTNLQVLLDANAPTGGLAVTYMDGGAQAVTCTVTAGTKTCSDTTHSFNPVAADPVDWRIVVTNTYTGGITILATDGTSNVGVTSVATGTGLTGGTISTTGTISCVNATSAVKGCVQVDNTTVTASAGVITTANTTIGGASCTPGGSCAPRTIVSGISMVGTAQNNTRYFNAVGTGSAALAAEIQEATPIVKAITWDDFYCYANTAPASGQTVVLTLRKNSASPGGGLVCTITGTTQLGVVTGSAVSYAIGDTIDIMGVISATAGTMTNGVMWGGTIR